MHATGSVQTSRTHTGRYMYTHAYTDKQIHIFKHIRTDTTKDKGIDKRTNRRKDRQTDSQTNKQTNTQEQTYISNRQTKQVEQGSKVKDK